MKNIVITLFFLFLSISIWSQDTKQNVSQLLDSVQAIGPRNIEKSEAFIHEAKQLITTKDSEAYLEILLVEAEFLSISGKFDQVLVIADSLINQNINSQYKTQGYIEKSIVFNQQSKNESALNNLKLALPIAESNNDTKRLSNIFKIMGNLSFYGDNMGEAIRNYKKAASYSAKDNNLNATGLIYNNICRAFEGINKLDSAMYYNNKNLKLVEEGKADQFLSFSTYLNEADFQNRKGQTVVAINAIEKAMELAYQIGNPFMIGSVHQVHSTLHKTSGDYDKAIEAALKAISIFEKIGAVNYIMQTQFLLQEYQALSGNHEAAYNTYLQYKKTQDSLNVKAADKNLKELRIQYETAERDLLIAEQESEIYKKDSQQKILIITIAALVLLSIISFLFFKQRQKNQQQKISNLENEKENVALKSLMAGEEKERSRIARDLHDGLGGILAAAKMQASNNNNIEKVITLIDDASKESRRISHNMLPESLIKKGLHTALEDFVHSINESGLIDASYQSINLKTSLPQSLQLSIYRVIQELLNNIIKHADATEALVQLQENESHLLITVEDNGKGFSTNENPKGIGLSNIESRLSLIKGKLKIDNNQKEGTSVYIELKLDK